jgi:hypothetical protein
MCKSYVNSKNMISFHIFDIEIWTKCLVQSKYKEWMQPTSCNITLVTSIEKQILLRVKHFPPESGCACVYFDIMWAYSVVDFPFDLFLTNCEYISTLFCAKSGVGLCIIIQNNVENIVSVEESGESEVRIVLLPACLACSCWFLHLDRHGIVVLYTLSGIELLFYSIKAMSLREKPRIPNYGVKYFKFHRWWSHAQVQQVRQWSWKAWASRVAEAWAGRHAVTSSLLAAAARVKDVWCVVSRVRSGACGYHFAEQQRSRAFVRDWLACSGEGRGRDCRDRIAVHAHCCR